MMIVMVIFFVGHGLVQAVVNPEDGKEYDQVLVTKYDKKGAIYEYTNKEEFCHR
jgi:hypothetical protein